MKLDRREFITLVGASVASSSTPLFGDVGGNLDALVALERNLAIAGCAGRRNSVFHRREDGTCQSPPGE